MSFGGTSFGGTSFGEDSESSSILTFGATIEQRILGLEYQFNAIFEQRVYTPAQFSATIEQRIVWPSTVFTATIEQRIWQAAQFSATIEQQIYGPLSGVWEPVVVVDGTDISAQITGEISISPVEDGSTIARLTFVPDDGSISLESWVGVAVKIDYKDGSWQTRKFTGICTKPQYFPRQGTMSLNCSSDLQGSLEAKTREQLDALIADGIWSKDVFEDDADGWQYAQDLASTTPASIWNDKNGAVKVTPWAAKTTEDIALTEADIIGGDVSVRHASKRDMVKRILMEIDYEFFNLRTRQHVCSFGWNDNFCHWLQSPFQWPRKTMVRSAAESTGWRG